MNVLSTTKADILLATATGYDVLVILEWGKGRELAELFQDYTVYYNEATTSGARHSTGRGEGICVLVRRGIPSKLLKHTRHVSWVQVGKGTDSIVVGAAYMHCNTSGAFWERAAGGTMSAREAKEAAFDSLRTDLLDYRHLGHPILLGDFNACVATKPDLDPTVQDVLAGLGLAPDQVTSEHIPGTRRTQDRGSPDSFGHLLVDKCCLEAGCVLLNGRACGDEQGACTRAAACLDYGLTPLSSYHVVQSFTVLPPEPLSDHQPLECVVSMPCPPPPARDPSPGTLMPRWDPNKREQFMHALWSGEASQALSALEDGLAAGTLDPVTAWQRLTQVIKDTALAVFGAAGQGGSGRLPSGRPANSWFKQCQPAYQALQAALRRGDSHAAAQLKKEFKRQQNRCKSKADASRGKRHGRDLLHNPRRFWSGFRGPKANAHQFDVHQLHTFWEGLYGGQGRGALGETGNDMAALLDTLGLVSKASQGFTVAQELNAPLSLEEVVAALRKLHSGRAPGPDGLRAEHFKHAYFEIEEDDGKFRREYPLTPILHKLFNALFTSGEYVREWSLASLTAVFKKGDAADLDNYRAIAVGAVLGKLYSVLLDTRLSVAAEKHGWRAEGQAGFRPKKSTVDHVFVLRQLIETAQLGPKQPPLYACFVDFRKAYDKVRRDYLVRRLAELGVHGPMLQAIVQMYWSAPLVPKVGTVLGPHIDSTCGVKQGDPLSPLLFGLFIDEFEQWLLRRHPHAGVRLEGRLVQMLLYADDMVLLADTPQTLQRQLDLLHEFCLTKDMEVNVPKTEIVVFRHSQRPVAGAGVWSWQYNGQPLQVSAEFRYLGIILHDTRGVMAAVPSLVTAAKRATYAMISRFRVCKIRDIALKLKLFQALVAPIMQYCGEIWGPDLLVPCRTVDHIVSNQLQQVQSAFLRNLGRLRTTANTQVLHREFCMQPVARAWVYGALKLWERLRAAPPDSLLGAALRGSISLQHNRVRPVSWAGKFFALLSGLAADGSRDPTGVIADFVTRKGCEGPAGGLLAPPFVPVYDAWDGLLQAPWQNLASDPRTAPSDGVRLVTYDKWFAVPAVPDAQLEPGFPQCMPAYVKHTGGIPFPQVKQLIQFRCSAHHLRVETGRWERPQLARGERVCEKCTRGVVEDELHVLFECPAYSSVRTQFSDLFAPLGGIEQAARSVKAPGQFSAFMDQNPQSVAAFVWECMQHRRHEAPDLLPYAPREELLEFGFQNYIVDDFVSDDSEYLCDLESLPMEPGLAP